MKRAPQGLGACRLLAGSRIRDHLPPWPRAIRVGPTPCTSVHSWFHLAMLNRFHSYTRNIGPVATLVNDQLFWKEKKERDYKRKDSEYHTMRVVRVTRNPSTSSSTPCHEWHPILLASYITLRVRTGSCHWCIHDHWFWRILCVVLLRIWQKFKFLNVPIPA